MLIDKLIPIGEQKFAYQGIGMDKFEVEIIARLAYMSKGSLPYPNDEKETISTYELSIKRFTSNAIEICLTKIFKDKTTKDFLVVLTFEEFVNQIFKGLEANVF